MANNMQDLTQKRCMIQHRRDVSFDARSTLPWRIARCTVCHQQATEESLLVHVLQQSDGHGMAAAGLVQHLPWLQSCHLQSPFRLTPLAKSNIVHDGQWQLVWQPVAFQCSNCGGKGLQTRGRAILALFADATSMSAACKYYLCKKPVC